MFFKHHKMLMLALLIGAAANQLQAQNEKVDIVKDFEAFLLESNKIEVTPTLPPLDTTLKVQTYNVQPRPLSVTYPAPRLRPIGLKTAQQEEPYNGFAKLGLGIPLGAWAEGGYYFGKSEKFDGKAWFRHFSQNNDNKLENQRYNNNEMLVNGNYYFDNGIAIEGNAGFTRNRFHYYGYDHDSLSYDEEVTKQYFQIIDLGGRVYNGARNEMDVNYFITPKFYRFTDNYSNRETGFLVDVGATKWFGEKHPLTLIIRVDQTNFKDNEKSTLNNLFYKPSFTYHHDLFYAKAGVNIASNRDVYTIFPDVEVGLRIFGDGLQMFAGATGDLRKNTFRSMATYSPFMDMREAELRNTSYNRYYGGLKGELGWLTYQGEVAYENAQNLALFQAFFNPLDITRFQVIYDTVNIFNIQANAQMEIFKDMTLSGTFSTTIYTPENESFAWGLPVLESHIQAEYAMFEKKLRLKGGIFLADDIPYLDRNGVLDRGDFLFDLSVGGTYQINDKINLFADFNNLLNNRRERWADYPTLGTNLFAGVQMKFN